MRGNELLDKMELMDSAYVEAAEAVPKKKGSWVNWAAMAACFAFIAVTAASILPNYFNPQEITPPNHENGVISDSFPDNTNDNNPTVTVKNSISMDNITLNEISDIVNAARIWYDPELYDYIKWDKNAVIDYYGKDLTPAYIPDGLTAAIRNGTAFVFADKSGKVVEDTVWLGFYHAYYEDGSPKLTESVSATKGFSITASKIGILNDCCYIMPENEVKTSDIGGTVVTFGYRSMPYGPYDAETKEPSGYYDLYVAEFEHDAIQYQIIAEQMEVQEVVKIVSSIIYGKEVTVEH